MTLESLTAEAAGAEAVVDVVIVAFQSATSLPTAIACAREIPVRTHIVVVDYGGNDLEQMAPLIDRLIVSENRGFGAGQNLGANAGNAPYILLLNPDAYVVPDAITRAVSLLTNQPHVAAVQGVITSHLSVVERSHGINLRPFHLVGRSANARRVLGSRFGRLASRLVPALHDHVNRIPPQEVDVEWLAATALLIRRVAFEAIGGFDESYFLYGEDFDLCHRLRKEGWRLVALPTSWATHLGGASSESEMERELEWWRGTLRYGARVWNRVGWALATVASTLMALRLMLRRPSATGSVLAALLWGPAKERRAQAHRPLVARPRGVAAKEKRPGSLPSLLIVTPVAPPAPSGQAIVLRRLLDVPGARALYATQNVPPGTENPGNIIPLRPAEFYGSRQRNGYIGQVIAALLTTRTLLKRSTELTGAIREHDSDVVVGCTAGPTEIPAAWVAAKWMRRPFVAYLFDDPVLQWPSGPQRRFAAIFERVWSRHADGIVVPNEALAATVSARTSTSPVIVRNPVSVHPAPAVDGAAAPFREPVQILYTGAIYGAQEDSLARLVLALSALDGRAKLHIYTSTPLTSDVITGPHVVVHSSVDADEATQLQRGADILFLPLSFDSTTPEVVATASPAKLGEYLMSGRPMLVHAPAGSYVSSFAQVTGTGVVVDRPDPHALAVAIVSLRDDKSLRQRVVEAASVTAPLFDATRARASFWDLITSLSNAPKRARQAHSLTGDGRPLSSCRVGALLDSSSTAPGFWPPRDPGGTTPSEP